MYFPRPKAHGVSEEQQAFPLTEPVPSGTAIILVVEDDEDVRGYSVNAVRHLGYTVLESSDSANALAILNSRPDIRLLFTDIGLPGMNGRELADAALLAYPDLRVVYTSGYARMAIANLGLLEHGVHLLPKPFRIDSLARMLRSALDGP